MTTMGAKKLGKCPKIDYFTALCKEPNKTAYGQQRLTTKHMSMEDA